MKKYRVCGTVTISVYKEVWANNESEAYDKAYEELDQLTEYCGNGSYDRLIGVENEGESVAADGLIEYNDIENKYYLNEIAYKTIYFERKLLIKNNRRINYEQLQN
jgi:hypothetical protein